MIHSQEVKLTELRVTFFLLLCKDAAMRRGLCASKIAWYLPTVCPHKACVFYEALENKIVPTWVKDESVGVLELEEILRDEYLVA